MVYQLPQDLFISSRPQSYYWTYSCQEAFDRISLLSHRLVLGKHRHYRYGISYIYHQFQPSFPVQSTYSIKVGSARFIYDFSYVYPRQARKATHNTNTPLGEGSPHLGLLVYGTGSHGVDVDVGKGVRWLLYQNTKYAQDGGEREPQAEAFSGKL